MLSLWGVRETGQFSSKGIIYDFIGNLPAGQEARADQVELEQITQRG